VTDDAPPDRPERDPAEAWAAAAAAPATSPPELCANCLRTLKPGATFCGGCGVRRIVPPSAGLGDVKMVITFFVSSLAVAAVWMIYARFSENEFATDLGATLTLGVLTLGFAVKYRPLIIEPAREVGFGPLGYLAILVASVPIVLLVSGYANGLNGWFGIHMPGELAAFDGRHWFWPVLMLVVLPPLEEELAFRGLIFGGLRRSFTVNESFIVSSFAFAILHLSVPTLVTHFPLGLYFCWLRARSGSLWPSVVAHACHNLGVTILAWT